MPILIGNLMLKSWLFGTIAIHFQRKFERRKVHVLHRNDRMRIQAKQVQNSPLYPHIPPPPTAKAQYS